MSSLTGWLDLHPYYWPFFIFFARILDVSIGTVRTIMVVRGHRLVAAWLGLIEVTVWVVCVSGVLRGDLSGAKILAWAGGFATGNACGIWLEQKLAMGHQLVRLISRKLDVGMADVLRNEGFMVTQVPAEGRFGEVSLCFAVVKRSQAEQLLNLAERVDPDVFVTVEDLRHTSLRHQLGPRETWFPATGWRAVLKKK